MPWWLPGLGSGRKMAWFLVHVAGELGPDAVQRCTRCDAVLADYRNTMVPAGTPSMRGWEPGAVGAVGNSVPVLSYLVIDRGLLMDEQPCEWDG